MNATFKKQPKDINSVSQTRFLLSVVRLAPVCALLGWAIGGKWQGCLGGSLASDSTGV